MSVFILFHGTIKGFCMFCLHNASFSSLNKNDDFIINSEGVIASGAGDDALCLFVEEKSNLVIQNFYTVIN